MKIKKGDTIMITTGRDAGRQGQVSATFPKNGTVLVPGLNQYKKHRKPQGENRPGEIVTLDRPIEVSKIALICPKCKQPTRVGYKVTDSQKVRICRKCDNVIEGAAKETKTSSKSETKIKEDKTVKSASKSKSKK